jgi:L-ribulose-5-phosphate 4-epimerase
MSDDVQLKMLELIEVAKRAFDNHLQTGTGGNISLRVNGSSTIIIKRNRVDFCGCTSDNLLVVDLDRKILRGSDKPSRDMVFHPGIYRTRLDVNGIVHVHSPMTTFQVGCSIPISLTKCNHSRVDTVRSHSEGLCLN